MNKLALMIRPSFLVDLFCKVLEVLVMVTVFYPRITNN
jgi:hypothetical protein